MGVLPISLSKRRACVVVLRGDSHLCNDKKKKKKPPKTKRPTCRKGDDSFLSVGFELKFPRFSISKMN